MVNRRHHLVMILLIHFKFKQTSKSEGKSSYDGFTDKNLLIIGINIISMVYFYGFCMVYIL